MQFFPNIEEVCISIITIKFIGKKQENLIGAFEKINSNIEKINIDAIKRINIFNKSRK